MVLVNTLAATFTVSLISLVGVITLAVNEQKLKNALVLVVGFATGSMIGAAFFRMLPEALETSTSNTVFAYVVLGFSFFFVMERYLFWRHCHEGVCEVHSFTYLNLIGDGVHNFVDGMVIAASFATSPGVGLATTLAIMFHEIPQELGDFSVLLYGGFSRGKALLYNFLCGLTAMAGALLGYFLSSSIAHFSSVLLPLAAGGFIYIAASDLLPELHRQKDSRRANLSLLTFFVGLLLMRFMGGH